MGNAIRRWADVFGRVEQTFLVVLLLVMVGLASLQILLRILFSSGIIWGDVALRHLVLWVGLVGAVLATRQSRHIAIDVLPRVLKGRTAVFLGIFTDFFSAFVAILLTRAGLTFVRDEFLSHATTFLGIPGWVLAVIFPLAFSTIAFHFSLNGLVKLTMLGEPDR